MLYDLYNCGHRMAEDYPIATFYEPADYGWSESLAQAYRAVIEFSEEITRPLIATPQVLITQ